jgi:hypothetical protein
VPNQRISQFDRRGNQIFICSLTQPVPRAARNHAELIFKAAALRHSRRLFTNQRLIGLSPLASGSQSAAVISALHEVQEAADRHCEGARWPRRVILDNNQRQTRLPVGPTVLSPHRLRKPAPCRFVSDVGDAHSDGGASGNGFPMRAVGSRLIADGGHARGFQDDLPLISGAVKPGRRVDLTSGGSAFPGQA